MLGQSFPTYSFCMAARPVSRGVQGVHSVESLNSVLLEPGIPIEGIVYF